jgi:hypothetical protein
MASRRESRKHAPSNLAGAPGVPLDPMDSMDEAEIDDAMLAEYMHAISIDIQDAEGDSAAEPSPLAADEPVPDSSTPAGDGRSPVVEPFVNPHAGSAFGERMTHRHDLNDEMKKCGVLANPDDFEAAEFLMTCGLSGRARDRLLKLKKVSRTRDITLERCLHGGSSRVGGSRGKVTSS